MAYISIVIVTWNSQAVLPECVASLFRHVPEADFELILVDNASRAPEYLDAYEGKANIQVIRNEANLGFSKGVNIGLRAAKGTHFLTLNPDIIFTSNPFPALLETLERDPRIGVVGPLLYGVDGRPQILNYYPTFPSVPQFLLFRSIVAVIPPFPAVALRFFHSRVGTRGLHFVDQIPGAFMLFRRELFGAEALSEAFFIWMEDVDFCLRVHRKGLKVAALADERVTHIGGTSFDAWSNERRRLMFATSYLTYLRIHFALPTFWLHTGLMFFNSLSFFLLTPVYFIRYGYSGMKKRLSMEAKTLSLISRAIVSPFFRGTKKAPLPFPS